MASMTKTLTVRKKNAIDEKAKTQRRGAKDFKTGMICIIWNVISKSTVSLRRVRSDQ